jgi:hypothetical protein
LSTPSGYPPFIHSPFDGVLLLLQKGSLKMNMQLYHQVAAINTKVKTLRNLLEQVEMQQSTLQQLLLYRRDGRLVYPDGVTGLSERPGDAYVENLTRTGFLG